MKQLYLFDHAPENFEPIIQKAPKGVRWKMCIDGASRNNPGPSGVGIYILRNDLEVESHGFYVGKKTNNQAEYLALLLGLFFIKKMVGPSDRLSIVSDSQLLVRQLRGSYKVKDNELKSLHGAALRMLKGITYDVAHVMREYNVQADDLANQGIDKKRAIPREVVTWLQEYDITV